MTTYEDPRYLVLDASTGNGRVVFRGTRPTVELVIHRIVVEASATGSGVVSIIHRGQTKSQRSIALTMEATGSMELRCSEEASVEFANGPRGATMKVTAHVEERAL